MKIFKPSTKAQQRLVDTAVEIQMTAATIDDAIYMARQLVQATLPHSDPKTDTWRRVNGNFALGIQSGFDPLTGKTFGLPFGIIPRLLLFWIITEAVRTKNPKLHLGHNMAEFMRAVGLNPQRGGKRGDPQRMEDQMQRLFCARITFAQMLIEEHRVGQASSDMQVTAKRMLWWNPKAPQQGTLWGSWIELDPRFFNAITAAPIPVDPRALRALKRSPLALDLYALCCYEAFRVQKSGKHRFIPWRALQYQLGADYGGKHAAHNFAVKVRKTMRKVRAVMPYLKIGKKAGGLLILPGSLPAIPSKRVER